MLSALAGVKLFVLTSPYLYAGSARCVLDGQLDPRRQCGIGPIRFGTNAHKTRDSAARELHGASSAAMPAEILGTPGLLNR